jgi:hypothetical protein
LSIQELIKQAKKKAAVGAALTPAAVRDLRKVLAANDREGNRKRRVSCLQFVAFLKKEHKIDVNGATVVKFMQTALGRGWEK